MGETGELRHGVDVNRQPTALIPLTLYGTNAYGQTSAGAIIRERHLGVRVSDTPNSAPGLSGTY